VSRDAHARLLVVVATCLAGVACSSGAGSAPSSTRTRAVPVTVATVKEESVPVEIHAIGRVEAQESVTVTTQVDGELIAVDFTEGRDVKKGELLFEIDPRPYQRALQQAQANLARVRAQAENAAVKLRRVEDLAGKGIVSSDDLDQAKSTAAALEATVAADLAAVETAKLQLQYTTIHSPIDGRTGALLVHRGNVVKAKSTELVTINRLSPIYVSFSVPETDLPEIDKERAGGRSLPVEAEIPGGKTPTATGVLTFVDNGVNPTTGTIQLKGTFANHDERLWPGQFVNVVLQLATEPHALVVPSAAVETGPDGQYVFVVGDDDTVAMQPIELQRTLGERSVVTGKLEAGERVVTDGQLRLVPGSTVEIRPESKAVRETAQAAP
jgi:multidrug efflux system membrane fusion protein